MYNVFTSHSYSGCLKGFLEYRKASQPKHFTFTNLASYCRVQRTYVSAVINGRAHFSADQLFEACHFLEMTEDEVSYTMTLLEFERSASRQRRSSLKQKLEQIRARNMKSDQYVEMKPTDTESSNHKIDFYLDVNAQLAFMFLTIPQYRGDLTGIRKVLGCDSATFDSLLKKIANAGLIRLANRKVELVKDEYYLPPTSSLYPVFRSNMRLKALEKFQSQPLHPHYSFSVFYSADAKTLPVVQAKFFEFLNWVKTFTQSTKASDVFQMNFDLLRWSPDLDP